jgi:hypothetical protein
VSRRPLGCCFTAERKTLDRRHFNVYVWKAALATAQGRNEPAFPLVSPPGRLDVVDMMLAD